MEFGSSLETFSISLQIKQMSHQMIRRLEFVREEDDIYIYCIGQTPLSSEIYKSALTFVNECIIIGHRSQTKNSISLNTLLVGTFATYVKTTIFSLKDSERVAVGWKILRSMSINFKNSFKSFRGSGGSQMTAMRRLIREVTAWNLKEELLK